MTIWATGRINRPPAAAPGSRGHTLLEVSMAMMLLVLLVGVAVPPVTSLLREQSLTTGASALETMAGTASSLSARDRKPFYIYIAPDLICLQDRPGFDPKKAIDLRQFPEGVTCTVAMNKKKRERNAPPFEWAFYPGRLISPLAVVFEEGASWIEQAYSPLTATIVEERFHMP